MQNVLAETADSPRDDYDRVMGVNLRGVWSSVKFELGRMRKQGSGAIVNCSALVGLFADATPRPVTGVIAVMCVGGMLCASLLLPARGRRVGGLSGR